MSALFVPTPFAVGEVIYMSRFDPLFDNLPFPFLRPPNELAKNFTPSDWRDYWMAPRDASGAIQPMTWEDDNKTQTFYPYLKPDANGCIQPMSFDDDFADGKVPPYLGFASGHQKPNAPPYDGTNLGVVSYDDPILNLSPKQQYLLRLGAAVDRFGGAGWQPQNCLPPMPPAMPQARYREGPILPAEPGVFIDDHGCIAYFNGTNVRPLCNFSFALKECRTIRQRGEPDFTELQLSIFSYGLLGDLTICTDRLANLVSDILKKYPICHLAASTNTTAAAHHIEDFCRDLIRYAPRRIIIRSSGFWKLDDTWFYVHDRAPKFSPYFDWDTGLAISCPNAPPEETAKRALSFLGLSSSSALIVPLFLLAHLGPTFELFKAAGFPPNFVAILVGKTGSLKTSTVLSLFRLGEGLPNTPEASFNDTAAAIEKKLSRVHGRVFILDDFKPAVTAASGQSCREKLEQIVRFFGDSVGKARSRGGKSLDEGSAPEGCCIITGEDLAGSESTTLRMLVLPIAPGDIDGDRLRVFQDNPELLQHHFFHFLDWCGKHGEQIIQFIKPEMLTNRVYFRGYFRDNRQIDIAAMLLCVARLLSDYLTDVGLAVGDFMQFCRETLINVIQMSEEASQRRDPAVMYAQAVLDLYDSGRISLAFSKEAFVKGEHIGFIRNGCWCVFPSAVYTQVVTYWRQLRVEFPLTPEKTLDALDEAGLIERWHTGSRLWKSSLPNRPNLLVLNADHLSTYLLSHSAEN